MISLKDYLKLLGKGKRKLRKY